ncbi:MAG: DNA internalization-related competence protein ComEC/Rec2 [Dehalococcoidia bacterium]|nr:DNA internalization-related competence protein ComEC/Rec2 [Dehalococcoidia bacterium]
MTAIYLGLSWIAGIFLGAQVALWVSLGIAIGGALSCAMLWRHKAATVIALLCLAAFVGGALRFQFVPMGDDLQQYRGDVEVKGIVAADPEPGDRTTALYLKATQINRDGQWHDTSGGLLAYAPRYPKLDPSREFPYYRYGDLLSFKGTLVAPSDSESFAYGEYLGRRGVYSIMRQPVEVDLLASGQGSRPIELLYQLRNQLSMSLERALPQPQSSLAQGILLGKRSDIPDDLRQDLSATGTWHIIAISGQNLSIIAGIVLAAAAWLCGRRRLTYLLLTLGLVWAYTALTGMSSSVLRAAIMVSLWLAAERIGRPNSAATSLVLAAAVMVAFSPQSLWDVGFQLSFAAMAGLIFLAPRLQALGKDMLDERTGWLTPLAALTIDAFAVTLAATVFTLPIIAFTFGRIALVGLPATLLALPALPAIIVTSALTSVAGLLFTPLGQVLGWVAWLFITYMLKIIELFSAMPFASIGMDEFPQALVWAYYFVLAALLWASSANRMTGLSSITGWMRAIPVKIGQLPRRYVLLPLLLTAALVWAAALAGPDDELHVSFLDVGQGDAALVQAAEKTILIDGGPSPEALRLQLGKRLPFWKRSIDLVILSHPDEDHVAGLVEVARHYQVKQVLEGGAGSAGSAYREWQRLLEEQNVPRTQARYGQRIDLGDGAWIEVLSPDLTIPVNPDIDPDNYSAVVRLVSNKVSFLFTGDIRFEAERDIAYQGEALSSTVLKVAHHGSVTSTSGDFLDQVRPQVAVVSVGAGNPFGHPSDEVLVKLRNVQVYRTDMQGTIEMTTDGERLLVKTDGR